MQNDDDKEVENTDLNEITDRVSFSSVTTACLSFV